MSSDDKSRGGKHGTVPGFGLPSSVGPMQVDAMEAQPESELGSTDSAQRDLGPQVIDGPVNMVVEPTPAPVPIAPAPIPTAGEPVRKPKGPPAVDIDLIYERRSAPLPDQPWVFLEIWTRNTIYQLDSALVCVDVIDQATRRSVGDHALRGARLVGGQSRDGEAMELSHPFPRPGSEAVFEQLSGRHVRFSQTSTVTRVVMRLRVLTVDPEQLLPTWEDVSGKWDARAFQKKK